MPVFSLDAIRSACLSCGNDSLSRLSGIMRILCLSLGGILTLSPCVGRVMKVAIAKASLIFV